jgi:hypothetical protein
MGQLDLYYRMRWQNVGSFGPTYRPTIPGQNDRQNSGKTEKIVHILFPIEQIDFS